MMEILIDSTVVGNKNNTRILMIAPEPYFEPRGTPISILQRLRALAALGYQVDLLTYHVGQDVCFPGLTIYRTPRMWFIKEVKIGPSGAKILLDICLFFRAIWMLVTRRYQVIHSHEEASYFAMLLSWIFRIPHVYDLHSSLPRQMAHNYGYGRFVVKPFELFEKAVLKSASAIITVDPDLEEYVRQVNPLVNQIQIDNLPLHDSMFPLDPRRIDELEARHDIDGRIPVVYTGTLEAYQGLDLVIHSAPCIREKVPNIIFLIVGGKQAQIDQYRQLARAKQVEDLFIFVGNVPPDEAIFYLSIAEILISTRQSNTAIPLKIYTYLYAGKPILATRTHGHARILQDDLALLIDPTTEAFSEGICRLVRDDELRERLKRNTRTFVATMQKDVDYMNKVSYIYRSVIPLAQTQQQRV
jgi:glycosyltransferase involved in cell wall biosynthesis